MKIEVVRKNTFAMPEAICCLAIPLFEDPLSLFSGLLHEADASTLERLCEQDVISSKALETYYLATPLRKYKSVMLLGLGSREKFSAEVLRRAGGKAAALLNRNRAGCVVFDAALEKDLPLHAFVEGVLLGQYQYETYKSQDETQPPKVKIKEITFLTSAAASVDSARQRCDQARIACDCTNWARDLASMPPNELTPTRLAELAKAMAKQAGCECEILDEDHMRKLGMNALLGVARGSEQRASLIVLHYQRPAARKTLAIVGKGVTFDTGGISIKPAESMHEMKYDMCGAAAVLGAMKAVCALKPEINVVAVVPAAENMPGSNAQRPGDIVRAYNGKTIEVLNTDAEGRLMLADALAYTVDKYKPDQIVDLATLSGACVVALGHYAAGLAANNDSLCAGLQRAGDESGDRVWPLPLWDDYDKLIECTHADIANIGPRGEASAIVGACFLKHFAGDTPWAHLDIAGTAWGGKHIPHLNDKNPTGFGVRLLTRWILNEAERAL